MEKRTSENGQAIVLIVLAIIAIFGFAALAVDGGRIYAERRRAQSAADAAALAAAYTAANSELHGPISVFDAAAEKAFQTINENDYLVIKDELEKEYNSNGEVVGYVGSNFEIHSPPTHGEYEECDCEYIQIVVHSHVDPIFMQVIGWKNGSEVTTESIARGRHTQPISTGNAIHATDHSGAPLVIKGKVNVDVIGGHILSNGYGDMNGGSGYVMVEPVTPSEKEKALIKVAKFWQGKTEDLWTKTTAGDVHLEPSEEVLPEDPPLPPKPSCGDVAGWYDSVSNHVYPGNFPTGISTDSKNKNDVVFEPGLYCIKDGGITINGNTSVYGDLVMFYVEKGEVKLNGNSQIYLKRPNSLTDANGEQWGGMLFYMGAENGSDTMITGDNNSAFYGTIYNPSGMCRVGGNSVMNVNSDIVCKQIEIYGNPTLTVNYVMNENYQMMPIVEQIE